MESYDVVIIGGGPAGLSCAEGLGGSDLKVLLIEKRERIGPKVCAGGLTSLSSDVELPAEKILSFKTQHIFLNGREYMVSLKNPLRTISRQDLGSFQLNRVIQHRNLTIRTGASARRIHHDHIVVNDGEKISFHSLVGAEGAHSLVRRHLGLHNRFYMGMQYVIPHLFDRPVWFLKPELLGSGYGWIFPHRAFTSAGVFFNPRRCHPERAKRALDTMLDMYGVDFRSAHFEAAPINCLYKGIRFGRFFLVGEAAGIVSSGTGEGIPYALTSGHDVARHLLDDSYQFCRIGEILKFKRRQEHILSVFDTLRALQSSLFRGLIALMKRPRFQAFFGA